MNTNKKILDLIIHGISGKFITKLTENQINIIHNRLLESKKENKEATTTKSSIESTKYTSAEVSSMKSKGQGLKVNGEVLPTSDGGLEVIKRTGAPGSTTTESEMKEDDDLENLALADETDGMDPNKALALSMLEKKELGEKFESKSQQKYFWSQCNRSKGKEKVKWCGLAKEFSDKTSKKDYKKMPEKIHPKKTIKVKKEQKEGYMDMVGKGLNKANLMNLDKVSPSVKWESELERRISQIVEKHLNPKMTKGDLLKFIREQKTKESPDVKPKEPKIKPKDPKQDPDNPYKVKPGVKPAPKAETKEQVAPPKPKTPVKTPKTPVRTPSPYQPKTIPAPKAGKNDIPSWLNFKTVGIKLK